VNKSHVSHFSHIELYDHLMYYSALMRHGVDVISPSSWEPQEEGMMSTIASFSLSKKPMFVSPGKSQTSEGDAC
jgi:hypothetical protein